MALVIDSRLLEPNGEMELIENFNRTLKLVDEGGGGGGGSSAIELFDAEHSTSSALYSLYTPAEIEAYKEKNAAFLINSIPVGYLEDEGETSITFTLFTIEDRDSEGNPTGIIASTVVISADKTMVQNTSTIKVSSLPEVTTADAGKFLVVNSDGEWAATTIPVADDMTF